MQELRNSAISLRSLGVVTVTYSATFATVDTLLDGWTALQYGDNIHGFPLAEGTHIQKCSPTDKGLTAEGDQAGELQRLSEQGGSSPGRSLRL